MCFRLFLVRSPSFGDFAQFLSKTSNESFVDLFAICKNTVSSGFKKNGLSLVRSKVDQYCWSSLVLSASSVSSSNTSASPANLSSWPEYSALNTEVGGCWFKVPEVYPLEQAIKEQQVRSCRCFLPELPHLTVVPHCSVHLPGSASGWWLVQLNIIAIV
jgi:hypothetical protein